MATKSAMAIGMLASVTNAPSKINKPPKSSTAIVAHAIKEGSGTPRAWRIFAKDSGPRASLA